MYPYIKNETAYSEVPMMATVHNYFFMETGHKEEFLGIMSEVKTRLDKIVADNGFIHD